MRTWAFAAAVVALSAGAATAQTPFTYRPIDTSKLIVAPTDAATAVTTNTTSGVLRSFARSVAGSIESNGFVRTINNLFGQRAAAPTVQAGYSPLPLTSSFQSTRYSSTFQPMMPVASTFGQTPNVPLPTATMPGR